MESYILQMIEMYYSDILTNCKKVIIRNNNAIIKMKNGETLLYDTLDNSIRPVPTDSNNMNFDECKLEFSIRLKTVMYHQEMTQKKLAAITGIPQSDISRYVSGLSLPNFYYADKIAKALDCSLDNFRYLD